MYTDSHCHLTCDEMYANVEDILARMEGVVDRYMIMCTNEEEYRRALEVRKTHPEARIAFGWFPGDAQHITDADLETLEAALASGEVDVLGEIGLDYHWDDSFKDKQQELFKKQLALAAKYNKPVAIHMRDATKDTLDILRAEAKTPIIFHCFSGSPETMREALKLNSFISFAGPVTFKNARQAPECVAACPLDRMLSETDSPYMAPVPMRGKPNEPSFVQYTVNKIAEIKKLPQAEVMAAIGASFDSLFK